MSHLELMRDEARVLPLPSNPLDVTSARIWHCKFRSLDGLGELSSLQTLVIATFPGESFEPISALDGLRYLSVLHFPRGTDLTPLSKLAALETLSLRSLPSWDASGKVLEVASLRPLASLARLRHVELLGVRPRAHGLDPLTSLPVLESARISQFPAAETAAFFEARSVKNAFNPEPVFDAE